MREINGSYVTTVDGVDFYTDGIKQSSTTFSARVGYIGFSITYDQTTKTTWQCPFKASISLGRSAGKSMAVA